MKRMMVAFAMAVIFACSTAGVSFAAKLMCTVDSVENGKVTMTCEDTGKLAPGDKVKVDASKKGGVEGC